MAMKAFRQAQCERGFVCISSWAWHFDRLSPFDGLRMHGHFDRLSANGGGGVFPASGNLLKLKPTRQAQRFGRVARQQLQQRRSQRGLR